jgi:hypothetical protein
LVQEEARSFPHRPDSGHLQQRTTEYIDDFFVNESSQQFSKDELELLSKGLNFIQKPSRAPVLDIVAEIETTIIKRKLHRLME